MSALVDNFWVLLALHLALNHRHRLLTVLASGVHGVKRLFSAPHFHEAVLQLPKSSAEVLSSMAEQGVLGGFDLQPCYPQLGNAILVCVTETKTNEDLQRYVAALRHALN